MPSGEGPQSRTWRLSPDLLGIVDMDGVFVQTNPAWQSVLGWSKAEIAYMTFRDFLHPEDVSRTLAIFETMKQGDPAIYFENRYRRKDGAYRWLSWVAVQEDDVFFCSARDVTEDKERARALKSIEDEVQLREQFVAILGHDLRNPLAAIGSSVRVAAREPHNETIAELFASISSSVDRMSKLIDGTMDFARARLGGGIPVEVSTCDSLPDRFEQVIEELRVAHPSQRIDLQYDYNGVIACDPVRLEQLLSNLVSNAITHGSDDQPIAVKAYEDDGHFATSVTNAGPPISERERATLFEPFVRSQDNTSLQGLGLGLYIAAHIAAAHDGHIDVTSADGLTTFTLRIPLSGAG